MYDYQNNEHVKLMPRCDIITLQMIYMSFL